MLRSFRRPAALAFVRHRPYDRFGFKIACIVLLLVLGSACGKFFPDANSVVAISVSPSNPSIQLNATQQFTATGAFGDGTNRDVTSSVTWTSSSSNVATINSSGLAMAVATGQTTITASQDHFSGHATLTVNTSTGGGGLTIACSGCTSQGSGSFTAALSSGALNFSANVNGSVVLASWSSSNTNVATIGQGTGIAMLQSVGTTTITATANGTFDSVTLTVQ